MAQVHKRATVSARLWVPDMKYLILSIPCSGTEEKRNNEFLYSTLDLSCIQRIASVAVKIEGPCPPQNSFVTNAKKKYN